MIQLNAVNTLSLSARRAWIEISTAWPKAQCPGVALRKESVDRNDSDLDGAIRDAHVALRKESVDRNTSSLSMDVEFVSRSPNGERG